MGFASRCVCARASSTVEKKFIQVRYSVVDGEELNCLSMPVMNHGTKSVMYQCHICDFALCTPCCMRAVHAMERLAALDSVLARSDEKVVEWLQCKVMIVGGPRAGKTSFVRALMGREFRADVQSTVGASVVYAHSRREDEWREMADGERAVHAVRAALEEMDARVVEEEKGRGGRRRAVVWDTEAQALHKQRVLNEGRRVWKGGEETNDREREVRLRLLFNPETKAKKLKVAVWDVAGQKVFHNLHHLYLTRLGIYVVVFNVVQLLKSPAQTLDFVEFWLNTVRLHAPEAEVMLVGTHWDLLDMEGSAASCKLRVDLALQPVLKKFPNIRRRKSPKLAFFAVSNSSGYGIEEVRNKIEAAATGDQAYALQLPMRWLKLLDHLTSSDGPPWLSLDRINEVAKSFGITSTQEVVALLSVYHQAGLLLHFTSTAVLARVVILKPQWLISEVSKVIRDGKVHGYDMVAIQRAGLVQDIERLKSRGIASVDLLQFFWGRDHYDFFVDLMTRTLLLSSYRTSTGARLEQFFLVPSLLTQERCSPPQWETRLKFDFTKTYLPDGCFERLTCLCLDLMNKRGHTFNQAPEVFKSYAKLCLTGDDDQLVLRIQDKAIVCEISNEASAVVTHKILTSMLQKVNRDVLSSNLQWRVLYYDSNKSMYISEQDATASRLRPWFAKGIKMHKPRQETPLHSEELSAFIDNVLS